MTYALIDSPLTPYSTADEIRAWIEELKKMEPAPQVEEEIKRSKELLRKKETPNAQG